MNVLKLHALGGTRDTPFLSQENFAILRFFFFKADWDILSSN